MKQKLKVSGKSVALPPASQGWILHSRPGGWVIAEGPQGERVRLMIQESSNRKLSANIGGRIWQGEMIQESRGSAGAVSSDADFIAQFPGKVRKILVLAGARVSEGESLILVEAMKMEFSIKAPINGKVTRILVQEGQQLAPGDRFLDFEAAQVDSP